MELRLDKVMTRNNFKNIIFKKYKCINMTFRVSDQHNREYGILEIQDSRLRFRYNLNSLRTEEKEIWLSAIWVDDGQWHTAKVAR